jgi:predicted Zn-dependent protease
MSAITALSLALFLLQADPLGDAISLYETGQYQKAADLLGRMVPPSDRAGDVSLWLGKSYLRLRKWDEAVRSLESAVASQPQSGTYHLWLGRAYGEKASRVSVFRAYGLARKVVAEFETAVRLAPDNTDARFDLLEYYLEAPGIVGGGKTKAEAQIRAISERNARLGHTALAAMYEHEKSWQQCRAELVKATIDFPKDPGAFTDLGEFLLRRHDFAGAESAASTALGLLPDSKRSTLVLAASRIELHREVPHAEVMLKKLASGPLRDDDPRFSEVYFWLGRAYSAQGKSEQARQAFEQSLRYDSENAAAKSALAGISQP